MNRRIYDEDLEEYEYVDIELYGHCLFIPLNYLGKIYESEAHEDICRGDSEISMRLWRNV